MEYGSSFAATRAFGVVRSLYDTVYNMNLAHLSRADADRVRAPRGRRPAHRVHHLSDLPRPPPPRAARRGRPVHADRARRRSSATPSGGPTELFYADLFASRKTDCRSTLGMPGQRDQHSGCVGAHMVENDLFDFMLLSLPDNDTYSHQRGPYAQVTLDRGGRPRDRADDARGRRRRRVPRGPRGDRHVRPLADAVEDRVNLAAVLGRLRACCCPTADAGGRGDRGVPVGALGAGLRAGPDERERARCRGLARELSRHRGRRRGRARGGRTRPSSARPGRGELRFRPAATLVDLRGGRWSVDGRPRRRSGSQSPTAARRSRTYPDALERLWSALHCPRAGDVLVSAAAGLRVRRLGRRRPRRRRQPRRRCTAATRSASLIMCGTGPGRRRSASQWTIRDVTPRDPRPLRHR